MFVAQANKADRWIIAMKTFRLPLYSLRFSANCIKRKAFMAGVKATTNEKPVYWEALVTVATVNKPD